jgi:thioesterase domain-containing protein
VPGGHISQIPATGPYDEEAAIAASVLGFHLDGSRPPLVCVRTWFKEIPHYRNLARHLGREQPLITIAPPRGGSRHEMPGSAEVWAAYAHDRLKEVGMDAPTLLGGWSFGGVVALELARTLADAGRPIARVLMIDSWRPRKHRMEGRSLPHKVVHHLDRLFTLDPPRRAAYLRALVEGKQRDLQRRWAKWSRRSPPPAERDTAAA